MWMHRLCGAALILLGAAVVGGEFVLLYAPGYDHSVMIPIGIPGVSLLTLAGLMSFTAGLGLAGAPHRVVHHARRTAEAVRRLARRTADG